jgi:hypothetical protein
MVPTCPSDVYDCYYITNSKSVLALLANTKWKPIYTNVPIYGNNIQDAMSAKLPKARPDMYNELRNYDYLCYIDSKLYNIDFEKIVNVMNLMDTMPEKTFCISRHPLPFKSVWDEFNLAMQYAKYAEQKTQNEVFIKRLLVSGYSETIENHYCTGFLLRKQCPKTDEINKMWYSFIQECGIECQISFSFVQQKYKDAILPLENRYCYAVA